MRTNARIVALGYRVQIDFPFFSFRFRRVEFAPERKGKGVKVGWPFIQGRVVGRALLR